MVWLASASLAFAVDPSPAATSAPAQVQSKTLSTEHAAAVLCVAYSPDGTKLASSSRDKTVKLWNAVTGECTATLTGHDDAVPFVCWSPDGTTLASSSMDGTIRLWDAATGKAKTTLLGHTDVVWGVSFSPDGKTLASGSSDKTLKLWDMATGTCVKTLTGSGGNVTCVAWSPDGKTLASGCADNGIKLWDVASGQCTSTLTGHLDELTSVSFSSDGQTLASGSRDNTIKLWNMATGQWTATLTGHTGPVYRAIWSPDGKVLATGSADNSIKLWDVASGQCTATLTGHSGAVSSVSWSPDGATLASASRDMSIKLWAITPPSAAKTNATPSAAAASTPVTTSGEVQVTTFAGSVGNKGGDDGAGSAAGLGGPQSVAVDNSGNIYVAEPGMIRKITLGGQVTTLAGTKRFSDIGSADGTGSTAHFSSFMNGLAVDGSGNVYVADTKNEAIRKITPDGVVTTLAGCAGKPGSTDGAGSAARFSNPSGVAVDRNGNVYVADRGNQSIRKITPEGAVTTFAGSVGNRDEMDGKGPAAHLAYPSALAADGSGNLYVAESTCVRKITPDGEVTTLAGNVLHGGCNDGTGGDARFEVPQGIAVDVSGTVYVADTRNDTIRKITPSGVVTTLAGSPGHPGSNDGTGAEARFNWPVGVAVDASGNLYVADKRNDTIRKITQGTASAPSAPAAPNAATAPTSTGASPVSTLANSAAPPASAVASDVPQVTTLAGNLASKDELDGTGTSAGIVNPQSIAVDSKGNIYVGVHAALRKITPGGVVTTLAGSCVFTDVGSTDGTGGAARFGRVMSGIGVDGAGNIYVADGTSNTIRKVTPDGVVTTLAGTPGVKGNKDGSGPAAQFNGLSGLAVDGSGNVYVADRSNDAIRKITPDGVVTTVTVSGAGLRYPNAVAVDASGNIYVSAGAIYKIVPGGVMTVFAGGSRAGSMDGTGADAAFNTPQGLTVDSGGNVYVADMNNDTIRKITPGELVTTLAGNAGHAASDDGAAGEARFNHPHGVAVDSSGTLYVADTGNNLIRKITQGKVAQP
jgi:WD40 repeat protein/streptogramin lyase